MAEISYRVDGKQWILRTIPKYAVYFERINDQSGRLVCVDIDNDRIVSFPDTMKLSRLFIDQSGAVLGSSNVKLFRSPTLRRGEDVSSRTSNGEPVYDVDFYHIQIHENYRFFIGDTHVFEIRNPKTQIVELK